MYRIKPFPTIAMIRINMRHLIAISRVIPLAAVCVIYAYCLSANAADGNVFKPGSGSIVFPYVSGDVELSMNVFYCIPDGASTRSNVLFVMHGIKRNAQEYRDSWIKHAKESNVILVVPEFSEKDFPDDTYALGNIIDRSGKTNPRDVWSYVIVDRIFEYLQDNFKLKKKTYAIYGHSAGAQFVHRLVIFTPEAKCHLAVAANAGHYCMPNWDAPVFYSLKNTHVTPETLKQSFGMRLFILLGMEDTDENHEFLNKAPAAMEQGKHRYERGQNFFQAAKEVAKQQKDKFNWKLFEIPGVAHSNSNMANELMKILKKYNN